MTKSKLEIQQEIHRKLETQYQKIMGRTLLKVIPHAILLALVFIGIAYMILQIPYDFLRAIALMGDILLFTLCYLKVITMTAKKETSKYIGSPEWEEEWKDM